MSKSESLEGFYKRKFEWMPERLRNEIGHFNVFEHQPIELGKSTPLPYKRRDFFKIMLVFGNIEMDYADKVVEVKKQALFFSNPQIPYSCADIEKIEEGYYCIFNSHFFHQFGDLNQYAVFQPDRTHVFELNDEQVKQIRPIFQRMFEELKSDYEHKYDVMRNLVFELLHFGVKIQPATVQSTKKVNASQRIATLFLELLERQFPIEESHPKVNIKSASEFAEQLNVHVNHLNRAIKEVTLKTTTQVIADRFLREAKIMLKHSYWNVSEIAYALGFSEVTHFNNFFKKHQSQSPTMFRKS